MYQYNFQFRKPYFLQISMNFNRNTNTRIVWFYQKSLASGSATCIYMLHWYHSESLDEESFSTTGSLLEDARPERNQDDKTITVVQRKNKRPVSHIARLKKSGLN